jgi:tetratricopeptide (TPR) repeat protein
MGHSHLTRRLLKSFFDRELTPTELVTLLLQHLEELCPVCRGEIEAWNRDRETPAGGELYELLTEALLGSLKAELQWLEELRPRAEKEFRELMALEPRERRLKVERAITRFRSPLLIDLLLERSRELVSIDPLEAQQVAKLAQDVALRLPDRYGTDVLQTHLARAKAHRANARRVSGDLRSADRTFAEILDHLDLLPDPLVRAEIWSFTASLRKDQRRFAEAEQLYEQTLEVHRQLGTPTEQSKSLISGANLAYEQGRIDLAIERLREALEVLSPGEDPRLELFVGNNLAWYLCEAREYEEARKVKAAHEPLYERLTEPLLRWRGQWLDARIAKGLGKSEVAEARLLQVRQRFIDADIGFDAALVSLDLAVLYMEQGRSAEVKRLAEEMLPIFRSQDIHREALASLLLFHKAAQAEKVNLGMVRDLASYLEKVRDRRALRQEKPS